MSLLKQKEILHDQMYEKKLKCDEAREEFLSEKGQVDDIVQKIIDDDVQKQHREAKKKATAFKTMQFALDEKEMIKLSLKERERMENEQYKKYLEGLDLREYEFKLQ